MRYLTILAIIVLLGCSAFKGDTGPMGPQGPKGDPGDNYTHFYDTTGILPAATIPSLGGQNYWYITLPHPIYDDSILVQTWVRFGTSYIWMPPDEWYYNDIGAIKIMETGTDMAVQGSHFKINVVYYH